MGGQHGRPSHLQSIFSLSLQGSLRPKLQMMLCRSLHGLRRKWQIKRATVVVRVPLIVVMFVKNIAGLAVDDVQRRVVQVRHVGGEAFGGPELLARLLHRKAIARKRLRSGSGTPLDDWD